MARKKTAHSEDRQEKEVREKEWKRRKKDTPHLNRHKRNVSHKSWMKWHADLWVHTRKPRAIEDMWMEKITAMWHTGAFQRHKWGPVISSAHKYTGKTRDPGISSTGTEKFQSNRLGSKSRNANKQQSCDGDGWNYLQGLTISNYHLRKKTS